MELNRSNPQSGPQGQEQAQTSKGLDASLENQSAQGGPVPPPPPAPTTGGTPAPPVADRPAKDLLTTQPGGQLDTIRAIKADSKAREEWYANLDDAVKNGSIKVTSIITTLKTKPENLSKSAARLLLNYAPMKDPEGRPTDAMIEKATGCHEHMVRSPELGAKVRAELPVVYEKLQACTVADLTKAEVHDLIEVERAYNRGMANRDASADQLEMVEKILAEEPALLDKMNEKWQKAHTEGKLTHGAVQDLVQASRDFKREGAKVELDLAVAMLKAMDPEDLPMVAKATLTRLEAKAGKTFKDTAEQYITKDIQTLVNPEAEQKDLVHAEEYFLQFDRAQVLRESAEAFAQV